MSDQNEDSENLGSEMNELENSFSNHPTFNQLDINSQKRYTLELEFGIIRIMIMYMAFLMILISIVATIGTRLLPSITFFTLILSLLILLLFTVIQYTLLKKKVVDKKEKKKLLMNFLGDLIELTIQIISVIGIILIYFNSWPYYFISGIPLVLVVFSNVLFILLVKRRDECQTFSKIVVLAAKMFIIIQIICTGLKIDNLVSWNWKEVFWAFWIFFSIIFGMTVGMTLLFVVKLYNRIVKKKKKPFELIGIAWLLLLSLTATIGCGSIIVGVIVYQENDIKNFIIISLYGSIGLSFFMLFLTFFTKKSLINFFIQVSGGNLNAMRSQNNEGAGLVASKNPPKMERTILPAAPMSLPFYLMRYSATYFKVIDEGTSKPQKHKKQNKHVKTQLKKPKNETMLSKVNNLDQSAPLTPHSPLPAFRQNTNQMETYDRFLTANATNLNILITTAASSRSNNIDQKNEINKNERTKRRLSINQPAIIENEAEHSFNNKDPLDHEAVDNNSIGIKIKTETNDDKKRDLTLTYKRSNSLKKLVNTPKSKNLSEHSYEKDSNCLICFEKQSDAVLMKCGHGGLCYECAINIWKKTGECYLCRLKINEILQIDIRNEDSNYLKVISSTKLVEKEAEENLHLIVEQKRRWGQKIKKKQKAAK